MSTIKNSKTSFVIVLLILLFSFFQKSVAQTKVPPGPIKGNWTKAGSPYYITGNVEVPEDSSLIIDAGVEVVFQGPWGLTVNGLLKANGVSNDMITIRGNGARGSWKWIYFTEKVTCGCLLNYCDIRDGGFEDYGLISILNNDTCVTVSYCWLHNSSSYGLHIQSYISTSGGDNITKKCSPTIYNNYIYDINNAGIFVYAYYCDTWQAANNNTSIVAPVIWRNVIHPEYANGITCSTYADGSRNSSSYYRDEYAKIKSNPLIQQNTIYGSKENGIVCSITKRDYFLYSTIEANPWISSNIISNCGTYGLNANNNVSPEKVIYNDFWKNKNGNFNGIGGGLGDTKYKNNNGDPCDKFWNIYFDPEFVDAANYDFHLMSTSKCIDAGDLYLPWDKNGSLPDIGAFPFKIRPISIFINTHDAYQGDTVLVPINVNLPLESTFSSAQISIGGYAGRLDFVQVVTDSCLAGDAGWDYQANETGKLNVVWSAGTKDITGKGVFFWLKFFVPETASGFIPITIESAVFNTGENPVEITSGGLNVMTPNYGDVDLNGEVQAYDASLILKYLVGLVELNPQQRLNANVSLDTTISALDATIILQYGTGMIESLPYDTTLGIPLAFGEIEMHDQTIRPGEKLTLPLQLRNGKDILSFEGSINFNPEHLIYDKIELSEQLKNFKFEGNCNNGEIKFAGAGTLPDGEAGTFAFVHFTVQNDPGTIMTRVELQRLRWNEEAVRKDVTAANLHIVTGVEENQTNIPIEFALHQNHPNPFNPETTIQYQLPKSSEVTIKIFNMKGQLVKTLVGQNQNAGYHSTIWNGTNETGRDVASGVYFYMLKAGEFMQTRKMLLVR